MSAKPVGALRVMVDAALEDTTISWSSISYDPKYPSLMIMLCKLIHTHAYNHAKCFMEKNNRGERIWKRGLGTPNALLHPFMSPSDIYQIYVALKFVEGKWSLQTSPPPRLGAISEVVPLIVLISIQHEVHIWHFFLENVSEQQWLVDHIDGVVRPCYPKKACQIHESYKEAVLSMMVEDPMSPL